MVTHKSGKRNLDSPPEEFIKYIIRKKSHVSFFYAADELRFEIVSEDVAKGTVTMSILGTLISEGYKTVEARITVTPREDTKSYLEYTFEFDKIKNHLRETEIVESLLTYLLISDTNNNSRGDNFKYNSFEAGYPAEEYFKSKLKAFKEDAEVKVEDVVRKNKRFTLSFISAPFLADFHHEGSIFQSMEVTITFTPKKDDNNRSRVKWTVKLEKFDYSREHVDFILIAASHIRETIMAA